MKTHSRARMKNAHNRRLASRMMVEHVSGSPDPSPDPRPSGQPSIYRAPSFVSTHRPTKSLEDPREEIWRLNLIQYYRGWLRHRPTPRGVTPARAIRIRADVYNLIPDRLKPQHLRRA